MSKAGEVLKSLVEASERWDEDMLNDVADQLSSQLGIDYDDLNITELRGTRDAGFWARIRRMNGNVVDVSFSLEPGTRANVVRAQFSNAAAANGFKTLVASGDGHENYTFY